MSDLPHPDRDDRHRDQPEDTSADRRADDDVDMSTWEEHEDDGEGESEAATESHGPSVPEPTPPAQPRLREGVVWTLVLILTALMGTVQWLDASTDDPTADQETIRPPTELVNASQMIVASHRFGGTSGEPEKLIAQLRALSDDKPINHVRIAIVAGHVMGREGAQQQLAHVDQSNPMVRADVRTLRTIYESDEPPGMGTVHQLSPDEDEPAISKSVRQRLLERHGWFGDLALGYRLSSYRTQAINQAQQTAQTTIGLSMLALVGVIVGTVLLLVAIVLAARGRLLPHYRRPRGWTQPMLETLAAFLFVLLLGRVIAWLGVAMVGPQIAAPVTIATWLVALFTPIWPMFRGVRWLQLRQALGWHCGAGFAREMGCGVLGYVAGLPILAVGMAATILLVQFSGQDASHPIVDSLARGGLLIVLLVLLLAVVMAPLLEESLFRGGLYHHLRGRWGAFASILAVGFLFAIIHPQGWTAVPALTATGAVLAMIREWRGSLIGSICAHGLHNLLLLMFALLYFR